MNVFLNIIAICGAGGGLFFIVFLLLKISSQARNAKQLNELYSGFEFRCGGRFDGITLTYPIVKVQLEENSIFIAYMSVILILPYQSIEVEIINTMFDNGIKIIHGIGNYPNEILLFTPYYKLLGKFIEENRSKMSIYSKTDKIDGSKTPGNGGK